MDWVCALCGSDVMETSARRGLNGVEIVSAARCSNPECPNATRPLPGWRIERRELRAREGS
jgi:hypothetical protein